MRKDNSFQTRNFGVTFFRFSILISSLVLFFVLTKIFDAQAESVTTAVTVGNSAPTFTSGPAENPASTTASPTNVGSNVTFQATGTDANGENYYLVVCSTSSATARTGQSPTCAATTWCTSTSTASGSPTSCTHTAVIGDASSNNWYAFVCDSGSSPSCSSGNPGTGDSGSPFDVNHAPSFTAVSNDSPKDPGGTITWSTTASDSTDSDNIKLLVCKTTGISGDACDGGAGDTWCSSSSVASNPTCQYSIPSVAPDGANDAYVYIVDAHNFPATGAYQGTNVSFTINNVTPVVSAVTINGGAAINLTESTTKAVTVTATVSDNNSCYGSELATVYAYMYRTGVGFTGCDTAGEANSNYCYPEVSCTVVGGSCTDNTDASANYTCTVNLQYYADPTDDNTVYPTEFWKDTVEAWDDDGASATSEVSTGVKVNSLTAFDITGSINFGNLGIG